MHSHPSSLRRPVVAANWKMNTSRTQAEALARGVREGTTGDSVDIILCPPFVWLDRVAGVLAGSHVRLGAQNLFWKEAGAYTGEVSPLQLAEVCEYVIVGHSERRTVFGESDETVALKLAAAAAAGLAPILCVGENAHEHQRGEARAVVCRQLVTALRSGVPQELIVAYEPVWAIGTGVPAAPEHAQQIAALLRAELREMKPDREEVRILYGGSVSAASVGEFIALPDLDGALVGGASLKLREFASICEVAAAHEARG